MRIGDKTLTIRMGGSNPNASVSTQASANPMLTNTLAGVNLPAFPALTMTPYAPPSAVSIHSQIPTKVLKLSNMVTRADLEDDQEYVDIVEDVRAECSQHGAVMDVLIPRAKEVNNFDWC
jgi:splicing factor U2AF subunit